MAMINCRECRASVSSRAKNCPSCGITDPAPRRTILHMLGTGSLGATILIFTFVAFLGQCRHDIPAASNVTSDASLEKAQWLEKFGGDPKALDHRFGDHAQTACSRGANDYLRSIAAHDFGWDSDAEGIFGTKFDKLSTLSAGPGLLTLLSTKAKLSNGFGAFEHIDVYCIYDVNKDKMVSYSRSDPATDVPSNSDDPPKAVPPKVETIVVHLATGSGVEANNTTAETSGSKDPVSNDSNSF